MLIITIGYVVAISTINENLIIMASVLVWHNMGMYIYICKEPYKGYRQSQQVQYDNLSEHTHSSDAIRAGAEYMHIYVRSQVWVNEHGLPHANFAITMDLRIFPIIRNT